jgi:6-pyruvoyltetrahydropterin/6-carboxytetrahydropterin synthase
MYERAVKTRFAAAHFLESYEGPCAQLHGHTWLVEVVFRGNKLDDKGMLVDFKVLKEGVRVVIDSLDHQNLNALDQFQDGSVNNPSAENLARYIYQTIAGNLAGSLENAQIARVRVNESPEASAVYWEEE